MKVTSRTRETVAVSSALDRLQPSTFNLLLLFSGKGQGGEDAAGASLQDPHYSRCRFSLRPLTRDYIVAFGTAVRVCLVPYRCPREGTQVSRASFTPFGALRGPQGSPCEESSLRGRYGVSESPRALTPLSRPSDQWRAENSPLPKTGEGETGTGGASAASWQQIGLPCP